MEMPYYPVHHTFSPHCWVQSKPMRGHQIFCNQGDTVPPVIITCFNPLHPFLHKVKLEVDPVHSQVLRTVHGIRENLLLILAIVVYGVNLNKNIFVNITLFPHMSVVILHINHKTPSENWCLSRRAVDCANHNRRPQHSLCHLIGPKV